MIKIKFCETHQKDCEFYFCEEHRIWFCYKAYGQCPAVDYVPEKKIELIYKLNTKTWKHTKLSG